MKGKKEAAKNKAEVVQPSDENFGKLSTKADLKNFLVGVRDKMTEGVAAPVYAMAAMDFVLTHPDIYTMLDNENKEIARDIWLRLKQSGMQLRSPSMLFGADETVGA